MNTFGTVIGYIIFGLSVLFTLGWCLKIRYKAKTEQSREKSYELSGFLLTISLILVPVLHVSPFHLLWMTPVSFLLGMLSIGTPIRVLWIFSSFYFSFWFIGINNVGRKYYLDGEYEKANNAFQEEIRNKPSSEAYFYLGLSYGKLEQIEKEIEAYKKAIELNPKISATHYNLGYAYNMSGDKNKAIDELKVAIRLRNNYLAAHYLICKIYSEIGQNENALSEYEIIKTLDSSAANEIEQEEWIKPTKQTDLFGEVEEISPPVYSSPIEEEIIKEGIKAAQIRLARMEKLAKLRRG